MHPEILLFLHTPRRNLVAKNVSRWRIDVKIAFDGGAFQQHIAGGILNVAIGLLNGMTRADPSLSFVLVADSQLGPVREEYLSLLDARPEVFFGDVGPAYGPCQKKLTTDDPRVRFEVDGRICEPETSGSVTAYEGASPRRSFRILSRADKPSETRGSPDTRTLGILLSSLTITSEGLSRVVSIRDPRLREGFQEPEPEHRWTNGCAVLPLELFRNTGDKVRVEIYVCGTMTYRLLGGAFDKIYGTLAERAARSALALGTAELERRLIGNGIEAYFVNHFIPAQFSNLRTFAILYDMVPKLFPHFFFADARENFERNIDAFKRAEHVFSISESSKNDLLKIVRIPSERVTAVGIDAGLDFSRQSGEVIRAVLQELDLTQRPYILCVGTLEPRKNHHRLIQAFHAIFRSVTPACDLVIVGKPGWGTADLHQLVVDLDIADNVRFLSDVKNNDLAALYSGALFSVYPSLYEGFGLPILEAMACGCAVLTSDRSSMPEIAGDAAYIVDPTSVPSIEEGLRVLLHDCELRADLVRRGSRRRADFSWDVSAKRVLRQLVPSYHEVDSCA
jgi:glycosyltransferase involved in cell wall biosynthesis